MEVWNPKENIDREREIRCTTRNDYTCDRTDHGKFDGSLDRVGPLDHAGSLDRWIALDRLSSRLHFPPL